MIFLILFIMLLVFMLSASLIIAVNMDISEKYNELFKGEGRDDER